ncbi:unnamed protein product [Brassica rapa subsp. narinosa]
MHRDTTTGSSRCLGAITPCQRESLVITGQTSHVLLSRTELERCIYDVRMRRTKTEPPSHHHRTDQIHTVVSRKPLEEAVMSPESRERRSHRLTTTAPIRSTLLLVASHWRRQSCHRRVVIAGDRISHRHQPLSS